ncbi:MAG: helix-turn-helix domain-containing protein [Deltaproteobacteria bacterium]|nr:helix-turn-helix domain-containing protein [Deltaproteobacteria bacterium]
MNAEDIKALRKSTGLSQRDLAEALSIDVSVVRDWEKSEQFATKAHVVSMQAIAKSPPARKVRGKKTPMQVLADPGFWLLVRKLSTHDTLRSACEKLAVDYDDPAENP